MVTADPKRECGTCTVCCKTHPIAEVNSPSGEWCRHCVIAKGCSIHASRPARCRSYECFWLRGKGEESDRPDRLNIVIDGSEVEVNGRKIPIINLIEVEDGARHQPRAQELTRLFTRQGFVVRHHEVAPSGPSPNYYYVPPGMFTAAELELFMLVAETRVT